MDLSTILFGKKLNPFVMNAAANYFENEITDYMNFSEIVKKGFLGAVVTKTLTHEERKGNPEPRIARISEGKFIQSMGLPNFGYRAFPFEKIEVPTIVSYLGKDKKETEEMTRYINEKTKGKDVIALEFNLACPNVPGCPSCYKQNGIELLKTVRENTSLPISVKIGYFSDRDQLFEFGKRILDIGINGVTAINSPWGLSFKNNNYAVAMKYGGISGRGIKELALGTIHFLNEKFPEIELIGVGGIFTLEDALDFKRAGARAIQICSALQEQINQSSKIYQIIGRSIK